MLASDISEGGDFLKLERLPDASVRGIVTNPPYEQAEEFCAHALKLTAPVKGFVAMLLRCDFDHAKRRAYLFADCPQFAKKIVLTRRIVWFVEADGKPKASPSFNHAALLAALRRDLGLTPEFIANLHNCPKFSWGLRDSFQ